MSDRFPPPVNGVLALAVMIVFVPASCAIVATLAVVLRYLGVR
jgi:hypothetical protein